MKRIFVALLFLLTTALFADEALRFVPEPYELGEISQGELRHVKMGGANVSEKTVKIESALCQGVGCKNFRFTETVEPRGPFSVEFDFSTDGIEGAFSNVLVLVGTDGKPYPAAFQGVVASPFVFSEKLFDAGYVKPGETREWTFYVWSADKKSRPDLSLSKTLEKEFSAKIQNVSLNVEKPDAVREGGKVPAQKITLRAKSLVRDPKAKQRSLSKIVPFQSKKFPKATPEVLVIGYWKE
jgi:hypothetical protein